LVHPFCFAVDICCPLNIIRDKKLFCTQCYIGDLLFNIGPLLFQSVEV
jgi:hypothetical protein